MWTGRVQIVKVTQWTINKLQKALNVVESEMSWILDQHDDWLATKPKTWCRPNKWDEYSTRWNELGELLAEGRRVLALVRRAKSKGKPLQGYGRRDMQAFLSRMNGLRVDARMYQRP